MKLPITTFLVFYALCFAVQAIGGYFTQTSVTSWYPTLIKSPLTPPGMWFGIVWTALYFLMAVAATRIYLRTGTWRTHALRWWLVQLLFGLLWSILFFGAREIATGLQIIVATWLAIAITLVLFYRTDKRAGLLLVPLLLWVSFASYLNLYIWQHN